MGWRGTIILALLTAAAGVYLWFEEAPPEDKGRPSTLLGEPRMIDPNAPVQHLLDFEPSDVMNVHLELGEQTREAVRGEDGWPGPAAAIKDFLYNLTQLGALMDLPASPEDLAEFGLQPPRAVLRLQLRGAPAPLVLEIGDRNPAVTGVYVRIGENGPVKLAGALVRWEFDKAFQALGDNPPG